LKKSRLDLLIAVFVIVEQDIYSNILLHGPGKKQGQIMTVLGCLLGSEFDSPFPGKVVFRQRTSEPYIAISILFFSLLDDKCINYSPVTIVQRPLDLLCF
jgi:hypothetical protein